MGTLITKGKSRCRSNCYGAKDDKCACKACGGINHGVGLSQAIRNTKALAIKMKGKKTKLNISLQDDLF